VLNSYLLAFGLSAMTEDKTPPISVTGLRADDYSPDAKNIIISLTTKYSTSDRKYSVPLECFYDFIVDLKRLNALKSATAINTSSQLAVPPKPENDLEPNRAISELE
jgi:hypothetical protein